MGESNAAPCRTTVVVCVPSCGSQMWIVLLHAPVASLTKGKGGKFDIGKEAHAKKSNGGLGIHRFCATLDQSNAKPSSPWPAKEKMASVSGFSVPLSEGWRGD